MKSILDPSFRYVGSANTDIRKTFEAERQRLKEAKEAEAEARSKVRPILERKKA